MIFTVRSVCLTEMTPMSLQDFCDEAGVTNTFKKNRRSLGYARRFLLDESVSQIVQW